ncbi:MAG: TatD family deoxyribonuclease [Lentisphaerae bacterium]|nr:TatD family deoxyribonuclease [Lentisphaerota bacterium]
MCKICPTVDFHTHLDRQQPLQVPSDTVRIISVPQAEAALPLPENCFATLELHPWHGQDWSGSFAELAQESRFIGIGEVGLDRIKGKLALPEQMLIFSRTANLAQSLNKPLVIHCVKCFSELLHLYKNLKWQVPTIIHYFCGRLELAQQLWQDTHFILSLPPKIYVQTKLLDFLRDNPQYHHRIVLETDDPSSGNIQQHYQNMANALNVSLPQLTELMNEQFERVYHAGNIR